MGLLRAAHLISSFATPFNHLRYRLLVHAATRLADRIDYGEVGLKRVQRRNRSLRWSAQSMRTLLETYRIVALLHRGGCVMKAGNWSSAQPARACPGYEHEGIVIDA